MRTIQVLFFLALLTSFSGCIIDGDLFDCERGNGNVVTRELYLQEFDRLSLQISGIVYIRQGPQQKVVVEGESNMINLLEEDVRNREWEIEFDRCVKNHDELLFFITLPDISRLEISGSGDIVGENTILEDNMEMKISGSGNIDVAAETTLLEVSISGSGQVFLEGNCDVLELNISGSGDLEAFDLITDIADISISGSGDARLFVNDFLKARISGSGDVFYKGNPELDILISGSGSVVDSN